MRKPAALFPILLIPGALVLASAGGARADAAREGPIAIEKCQTINQPGSYKLVNNLTFTSKTGTLTCLLITADSVTIDLAGFTITGPGSLGLELPPSTTAIAAQSSSASSAANLRGIAVRNGSISNFAIGVELSSADGSVVEGLRVFGGDCPCQFGIDANGIVRGNTVIGFSGIHESGFGMAATGVVTGNDVYHNQRGIGVGEGSTVIGNTVTNNNNGGLFVSCPSNVTTNTVVNNGHFFPGGNLVLGGDGCTNTNNVAP
jgi:hypothetical protein